MRRAKTDQEHFLQGTVTQVGRSKPPQAPSVYVGGRPRIPQHLDKLARAEFKRVCHVLEHRKTLTEGDRLTIAILAECYSRWVQTKAELGSEFLIRTAFKNKEGEMVEVVKVNPLVKIVEACEARILSLQSALGLTPQSRDKIKQTKFAGEFEVIPGSIADLQPGLLDTPEPEPLLLPPGPEEEVEKLENEDASS
ncbi:MAG: phage terminase small subunit P27 family [Candidatus Acidiferrales bacterium]